jgi:uroporphyrinogen-III synthase
MIKGLPLLDRKILVPRGKNQAKSFSRLVERYGGIPIEIPLISFRPIKTGSDLETIIEHLDTYDWIIFTSNVTVDTFMSFVQQEKIHSFPKIAVIGERTKSVLLRKGVKVDFVPTQYVAETFVEEFLPTVNKGDRILLPKGNLARNLIGQSLRNHGAFVDEIIVYETFLPQESRSKLAHMLSTEELDILLFTSPSTVDHFMSVVLEHQLQSRLHHCIIGCIGPITHEKILSKGLQVHISPSIYTVEEMVKSTIAYIQNNFGG